MANEHRGSGGGGADRRRDQTTRANKQPINLGTITPQELNRRGEELGKELARDIKANQIRNIYGAVQHIRVRASRLQPDTEDTEDTEDINRRLIFLKPKLAYASGRQNNLRGLRDVLVEAIDSVVRSEDPKKAQKARDNFFILMESIVAYHKFYGGKDS